MSETLSIYSQNCRGLNTMEKRRDVFHYLRKKKYDIICLQDVHLEEKMELYVKSEWGFRLYMSPYKRNSRGVVVLINNTFEHEIGRIKKDPNGNFIIIELTILGKKITLVNLYGPNDDKPQFYNTIQQYISEFGNEHVVWCGDWNLVLNSDLDTVDYKNINNPRARNTVINIIDENGYVDVWRVLNDTKKKFTWRRLIPDRKQARLDFFIVTEDMFTLVHDSDIVPGYRTDHSGIILKIKLQENERGRGYWKFNNSLLKDTNYVTTVKTVIDDTINLYKINNNNNNNNNTVL